MKCNTTTKKKTNNIHNRSLKARHRSNHRHVTSLARTIQVCRKIPAKAGVAEIVDHWLATQRKPLEDVEPIWALRWLLRKYFRWRGFACRSHVCNNESGKHKDGKCDGKCYASIEYRGTFEREADARWAASCMGGACKPIPFNAALPEETVAYKAGDVPFSEASHEYRQGVQLPFMSVSREVYEAVLELGKEPANGNGYARSA